jgi:zinc protease
MARPLTLLVLALAVVMSACAGSSANTSVKVQASVGVQRFTLPNGLDVVLHTDLTSREVAVNVRYDVGSRHDPDGASGLAHLVEHLTFRTRPDGAHDVSTMLERAGSTSYNATTSVDATCYFETVPTEELPIALFVEAARMARPLDGIDEDAFVVERNVVRNERQERHDNVPYGNLDDVATYLLFEGHSYGIPIGGIREDIDRLTLANARRFVATHYRPNNATLVIAGAFDAPRAATVVRELFEEIPGGPVPGTGVVPDAVSDRDLQRNVDVGADAPAVVLAWRVPPAGYRGWHEMVLAAEILGPIAKWKMKDSVRRIYSHVRSMDAASAFIVHAELAPNADPDDAVSAILATLEELADTGSHVTLGGTKSHFIAAETLSLENLENRADALQTYLARYGEPDSVQEELHEFSVVSRRDLANAVDRWLREGRRVRIDGRPKAGAPRAGAWPTIEPLSEPSKGARDERSSRWKRRRR